MTVTEINRSLVKFSLRKTEQINRWRFIKGRYISRFDSIFMKMSFMFGGGTVSQDANSSLVHSKVGVGPSNWYADESHDHSVMC